MSLVVESSPAPPAAGAFVYASTVHFDELDAMSLLHNSRFVVHMERAASAYFTSLGHPWALRHEDNPDQFHVVRMQKVEYFAPFAGTGDLEIEMWCERLGRSSCELHFRFTSANGAREHARGSRVIVKLDPVSLRPVSWTESFRLGMQAISRGEGVAS